MKDGRLCILAIDDSASDVELLRRMLGTIPGGEFELVHAASLDAAQSHLAEPSIGLILLDYCLGAETGEDVLRVIRASGDLRPVVVLTGHGDEAIAASVMRAGADDYVLKGQMDGMTLRRAIDNARAQSVRRKFEARNRQLLEDLQVAKTSLESKNRRLADLYETAHEFVDHVSHEFRTPLTVIREFASITRDGLAGETSPEQRDYMEIIINRVDELAQLVDDMLDISRLEAGMLGVHRTDCTLDEIVSRVRVTLERRAAATHSRLEFDVPPDLPRVFCDPEKIGRVIINLTINALKYGGDSGEVAVRARPRPERNEVAIAVSDNGPGIARENVKLLFERFRQFDGSARRGIRGFGLGLSIAKELVQLSLGEITIESTPGNGSTFTFTIPCNNRPELIRRFLEHGPRGDARSIALLDVRSDPVAAPDALNELDAVLNRTTRRGDLVLRAAPHHWLILACGSEREFTEAIVRLRSAAPGDPRARGADTLPGVSIELDTVWSTADDFAAVVERVESLALRSEPAYA